MNHLQDFLNQPDKQWRRYVADTFMEVPHGHLATYKSITDRVNHNHNLNIQPRNVAFLRRKLYKYISHKDRDVIDYGLHRIAKVGDTHSIHDSTQTREQNNKLRGSEGSLNNPTWW